MIQIPLRSLKGKFVLQGHWSSFSLSAVAYLWHDKSYLRKIVGDLFHFGECPIIALDYHQVLHIDRGVGPKVEVDQDGNLPPRHVETVPCLRALIEELNAFVKIILVSHIEALQKNESNL